MATEQPQLKKLDETSKQDQKVALDQTAILQRAYDKQAKLAEEQRKKERKRDESRIKVLLLGARHLASWIVFYLRNSATFIVVDKVDPEYIFLNPKVKEEVPRRIVKGFQLSELDIEKGLSKILENNSFDFVINTLAVGDTNFAINNPTYTAYYDNVMTQSIMNAIHDAQDTNPNIKFVHVSSDKVYGNNGCPSGLNRIMESDGKGGQVEVDGYWREFIIDENEACNPLGVKAISRYTQEILVRQLCKSYNIDYIIFRCANFWGRFTDQTKMLNSMMIDALRTKMIHIYGDPWASRNLVNIEDFAEFLRDTLTSKYDLENWNDIYNIGGSQPTRYYIWGYAQFVKSIISGAPAKGIDPDAAFVLPWGSVKIKNDPARYYEDSEEAGIRIWLDTSKECKAVKKLGYSAARDIRWDESFKELLLWNMHYHCGYNAEQIENARKKITYTLR